MSFVVLGINHLSAPLDLREHLAIGNDRLVPSLERLLKHVERAVVLCTCNRLEIYTFGANHNELASRIIQFLTAYSGVPVQRLKQVLYRHEGVDCVTHLFRVAGGLDSIVVGDRQILGQVRTAFSVATEYGYVRGPLSDLFHRALRVGRLIQRDTDFGENSRSVGRAGVQLARQLLGELSQRRVLVIGAGDAGRSVAKALADAGAGEVLTTSRTFRRADELARSLGGTAAAFEKLAHHLIDTDVAISSTGAPGYVLDRVAVQEAMRQRNGRSLLLIDIAVPRDIDPAVAGLDNVQLYDIDALRPELQGGADGPDLVLAQAERIVAREAEGFLERLRGSDVVPVITAIRQQAEEIRRNEVARTLRKLRGQWPPDTFQRLEMLTSALVNKLLHHTTVCLRDGLDPAQQQLVREIFNLEQSGGQHGQTQGH